MKKKIIVSVISDLVSDQRVHKVCLFLTAHNFQVYLIGRKNNTSLSLEKRPYEAERISCVFNKGVFLYAEFMIKLFFKLLFKKTDVLLSNDLDTLLPNFLISKFKGKTLVYDSHEYFTGVPELENSPRKRKIWQSIEKFILPKVRYAYTVNQSIADLYQSQYGINMKVVRNLPLLHHGIHSSQKVYPADKIILLLQGAGINEQRGAEELIESMKILPDHFKLYLVGSGTRWNSLKTMTTQLGLQNKIEFIDKLPFAQLRNYTSQAHLGFSLDKPIALNYKLSLPNKIFDYIHAGIPVLASPVVEVKNVIEKFDVGISITDVNPVVIAKAVTDIFSNMPLYNRWKENTRKAAEELCWQKEETVLEEIFGLI